MPITLAGIEFRKISRLSTREQAGFVRYRIPGLDGEIAQNVGRHSVRLQIEGIFYGPDALEGLEKLRKIHKDKKPVEFLADIVGKAYFAQVLLDRFDVEQNAREPDQFSYILEIAEYVRPPKPVLLEKPAVDSGILEDAQQFMETVQLPDTLQLPEIKDPTTPMDSMLRSLKLTLQPLEAENDTLNEIFGAT